MSLAGPHAADILGSLIQAISLVRPHAAEILGLLLQAISNTVHVVFDPRVGEPLHRGRGPHNLILHFWLFFEKTSKNETEIDVRPGTGALVDQGIWVLVPRISAALWSSSLIWSSSLNDPYASEASSPFPNNNLLNIVQFLNFLV
jgi:hypothetical protein